MRAMTSVRVLISRVREGVLPGYINELAQADSGERKRVFAFGQGYFKLLETYRETFDLPPRSTIYVGRRLRTGSFLHDRIASKTAKAWPARK